MRLARIVVLACAGAGLVACTNGVAARPGGERGADAPATTTPADAIGEPVGEDAEHRVTVLARDLTGAHGIAVDEARAFVTTSRSVVAYPINGGAPTTLADGAAPTALGAGAIAIDGSSVYWPDASGLRLVPKAGGDARAVVSGADPVAVAVDATDAYFATKDGAIKRVSKYGGADPVVIASAQGDVSDIAVDDEGVYWSLRSGELHAAYKGVDGVGVLATGLGRIESIVMDAECVIFADSSAGKIALVWKEGSEVSVLAEDPNQPVSLARDAQTKHLYWLDAASGSLMELAPEMGHPVRRAHGITKPGELALASDSIVWTQGGGIVAKVAK